MMLVCIFDCPCQRNTHMNASQMREMNRIRNVDIMRVNLSSDF